jgi:hypothetical protein
MHQHHGRQRLRGFVRQIKICRSVTLGGTNLKGQHKRIQVLSVSRRGSIYNACRGIAAPARKVLDDAAG